MSISINEHYQSLSMSIESKGKLKLENRINEALSRTSLQHFQMETIYCKLAAGLLSSRDPVLEGQKKA